MEKDVPVAGMKKPVAKKKRGVADGSYVPVFLAIPEDKSEKD